MSPNLENSLYKKYTDLFVDNNQSPKESCLFGGCECNNGWYTLLDSLCQSITNHIKYQHSEVDFWNKPANIKHKPDNVKDKIPHVKFLQIKEKFSLLRIYIDGGDNEIQTMISFAEQLSGRVCEICGKFGMDIGKTEGWIKSLCKDCAKKENRVWHKNK